MLFQERQDVVGLLNRSLFIRISKIIDQLRSGFDADVITDERFLKLLQKVIIDIPAQCQNRRQTRRNLLPGFAQMLP